MMILECETEEQINALNDILTQLGYAKYAAEGYTVDAEGVVGKINGVDAPNSTRIERWDNPKQPDNIEFDVWYVRDPRVKYPDFAAVITLTMDASGIPYTDKEKPQGYDYTMMEWFGR